MRSRIRASSWIAGVQFLAIVVLAVLWGRPADGGDEGSLDLGYLAVAVATPLLLAATVGLRWWLTEPGDDAWVARILHGVTCVGLAVSVVTLPLALVGELLEI